MKLNIIGCGNVGKTLAHLWFKHGVFQIQDVCNRSYDSAQNACKFIGLGNPIHSFNELRPADIFLIGTADSSIAECCELLVESNVLQAGNIVFHCSGALPASILEKAKTAGALIASIHPIKSFADPSLCITNFIGTFCGTEGDVDALVILEQAFQRIGGQTLQIQSSNKTFYHAASVVASNYLTALLELSIQSYVKAGLTREQALQIIDPIAHGTIKNIIELDTAQALTGPIARGDVSTVETQLNAFQNWKPEYGDLYRLLGGIALDLSTIKNAANSESLEKLSQLLK
ncbi:MAG: DUF2520 domain-containing protein [Gammaproteobacteria bacterium]|nr:DUF2520 domain-containing protein [Gammaproteobacteria bacterium]